CAHRARWAARSPPTVRRFPMVPSRSLAVVVLIVALLPITAHAWDRGSVQRFATLPAGTAHPEGIAVDRSGNVWVADFDVTKSAGPGDVLAFQTFIRSREPSWSSTSATRRSSRWI